MISVDEVSIWFRLRETCSSKDECPADVHSLLDSREVPEMVVNLCERFVRSCLVLKRNTAIMRLAVNYKHQSSASNVWSINLESGTKSMTKHRHPVPCWIKACSCCPNLFLCHSKFG
jgi:hypothetical protein